VVRRTAPGWSLYGAPGSQPAAIAGKSTGGRSRENKPNPLPWVATGCGERQMVNRRSISSRREGDLHSAKEEVDLSVEAPNPRKPEGSQGLDTDDHDNRARVGQAPARPPARRWRPSRAVPAGDHRHAVCRTRGRPTRSSPARLTRWSTSLVSPDAGRGADHDGSGFHSSHPVGYGHSASTRFTSSMDRSNLIRGKAEGMSREECLS
jgi:hypothetical protein